MLADRRYRYPLTVTDFASRYLITCEGLSTTKESYAFAVFERAFKDFGLPRAIRTDNGLPFSSPNALYGLSRLSVWWLRLGIAIERIKPGNASSVTTFSFRVVHIWQKWLNRRSQKRTMPWRRFLRLLARYPLPRMTVTHSVARA